MKLSAIPFNKIKNGTKTIESRLYDEKRRLIKVGDQIEFSNNNDAGDKVMVVVKELYLYPTFQEMFSNFPPGDFGGESQEELLEEIEQFYPREDQLRGGVVGIKLELAK